LSFFLSLLLILDGFIRALPELKLLLRGYLIDLVGGQWLWAVDLG
jgi:hypothetical protein